ncbi:hypothetical protein AVEN_157350-1 [Araneus ventricosus]|uniref:Uncharacterized protein n=1 Tax=Araneus ventricosus TaxID=182803 RepID=A0A4Y2S1V9_ARAVE|nr:hypothetical protein AVEN_69703-1 [Araneus ventricosus]GBN81923.1 hypothetical protein AVEN_157350-1 [Araneus ventricosus]
MINFKRSTVGWLVWDLLAQEPNLAMLCQTYGESTAYGGIKEVQKYNNKKPCKSIQSCLRSRWSNGMVPALNWRVPVPKPDSIEDLLHATS